MAYKSDNQGRILEQYVRFVNTVTSDPSKNTDDMVESIHINEEHNTNEVHVESKIM